MKFIRRFVDFVVVRENIKVLFFFFGKLILDVIKLKLMEEEKFLSLFYIGLLLERFRSIEMYDVELYKSIVKLGGDVGMVEG